MGSARSAFAGLAFACSLAATAPARGETFDVPSGRLGTVVVALGAQANATIVIRDADLAGRASPGVRGRYSLREAVRRALQGIDAEAIFHDRTLAEIVRRRPRPVPARSRKAPPSMPQPAPETAAADIVVTASKQLMPLDRYPGSVKIVEPQETWIAAHAAGGTDAIRALLPTLGATNLGPGRNKLFIRGIADSSFTGPTQATTGQYLGDVRLNYNAPDPNLNLYDIKRVEVLVGPQGALYGAGTLGGVIRLVPNAPDTQGFAASFAANLGSTRHGGLNSEGAAMLNLPLIGDKLALRFVAFGGHASGYIDAPAAGRRNINATNSYGQRLSLRATDVGGWTLDLGFVAQNIAADDGQYTLRGDPPLVRDTVIPQPFRNNYRLAYLTATRPIGAAQLTSTTSLTRHDLRSVFDATGYDGTSVPARYAEDNDIWLVAHETRISGGSRRAPWVAGVGLLLNSNRLSLALHQSGTLVGGGAITNGQGEFAAFAQVSRPLTADLTGTIGGRLTLAGSGRSLAENPVEGLEDPTRGALRFAGVFALEWHPREAWSAFYRYQQGYRAGGLGIALSGETVQTSRFMPDTLHMHEIGVRLGKQKVDRLAGKLVFFIADWRNIQADLISEIVLPYTTNIGQGLVRGIDAEVTWRPSSNLSFSLSAFLNDSKLTEPGATVSDPNGAKNGRLSRALPNVARDGVRAAVVSQTELGGDLTLNIEASIRYVGRSHLGSGSLLDLPQGNYLIADVEARLDLGRYGLSLGIDNLTDTRANTFSYGNPFGLAQGRQITPPRPRTVRLGIAGKF